jgi:hypothetical protein
MFVALGEKCEKRRLGVKAGRCSRLLGYLCFAFFMYQMDACLEGKRINKTFFKQFDTKVL